MNKKLAILGAAMLVASTAMAQTPVKGRVLDKEGHPVAGAAVKANGKVVAVTDNQGNFSISKMPAGVTSVSISYIGFTTRTVSVSSNMSIVMEDSNTDLDEVMVVAYGTTKKQSFTGSVSQVKAEDIKKLQVSNVTKALEGSMPGVQTMSTSGQPGSGTSIYVRGIGSINASTAPLILVDGVPYEGSLNSINPNDIETMSLQKDASAASIFGARGANGILMITTKKGRNEKTNIEVDAKWGWNSRGVSPYATIRDEGQYYEMYWESMRNQYIRNGQSSLAAGVEASKKLIKELGGYNSFNVADNLLVDPITGRLNSNAKLMYHDDWFEDPFQNGFRQEYNVGASGGNERTTYYASFNFLEDNSYFTGSKFERYSGRVKLDFQATDWLRVGINANYSHTDTHGTKGAGLASNMFNFAQFIAPIYPIYVRNADGSFKYSDTGEKILDYGNGANWAGHNRVYGAGSNPLLNAWNDIIETQRDVIGIRGSLSAVLTKHLTFNANISMDNFATYGIDFQTPIAGDALAVKGRGTKSSTRYHVINANQTLNYNRGFGDHHLSVLLGHETKADNNNSLEAQKTGFFIPDNPELDNAIKTQTAGSSNNSYKLEGFFGRLGYDYLDRYYFSTTYRLDASSNFAPEHRWGNFWSVGASWLMHKEAFMENTREWFDLLKLKASYGTQGNDAIGSAGYLDKFSIEEAGGDIAVTQISRGVRDLTWEKSKSFNVGLETSFWRGRLTADFDFFVKTTTDMITTRRLPISEGSPSTRLTNDMEMRNTGVEANIMGQILRTQKYHWTARLNLTHYKNELTRLESHKKDHHIGYPVGDRWRKKGGSLYDWYMVRYAGVDPNTGDALYYKDEKGADGKTKQVTTKVATEATQYQLGKSSLPFLYGGLSTTFEAYGLDLSVSTAFSLGGWTYDSAYASLMGSRAGNNYSTDMFKRWQQPGDVTNVPRLETGNQNMTGGVTNDRFLTKSDYFSLRNVTLGYTLPKAWVKAVGGGISSIRVYAVGDNLFLGSHREGLDPRQSISGAVSSSSYSAMRTVSFGLNVKF